MITPYVQVLARLLYQLLGGIEHPHHALRRNRYSIAAVYAALRLPERHPM